jgi:hypothetical protein
VDNADAEMLPYYELDRAGKLTMQHNHVEAVLADVGIPSRLSVLRIIRATQIQKIFVLNQTIVITLGSVRALVTADRCLLFSPNRPAGTDFMLNRLQPMVQRWSAGLPIVGKFDAATSNAESHASATFELVVLEAVMGEVCDSFERRLEVLGPVVLAVLRNLSSPGKLEPHLLGRAGLKNTAFARWRQNVTGWDLEDREEALLQRLLPLSNSLEVFRVQVQETRDAIQTALSERSELAQMQLSWQQRHQTNIHQVDRSGVEPFSPTSGNIEELGKHELSALDAAEFGRLHSEMRRSILSTRRELQEIENECLQIQHNIDTTRELVALNLARSRNRLQTLNLFVAVGALGFGASAMGAGIFGMNLASGLEEHPWLFWAASSSFLAITVLVFAGATRMYRNSLTLRSERSHTYSRLESFMLHLPDIGKIIAPCPSIRMLRIVGLI